MSQTLKKDRIIQVFRGEDGTQRNVYSLQKGGEELELKVTITSDQLPGPLEYTRMFHEK